MSRDSKLAGAILLMIIILVSALAPDAWAQSKDKTLHKFTRGANGYTPYGGLIFDQAGNLYGTTASGGASGLGTVFKLTPDSDGRWAETVIHSFGGGNDGVAPLATLTFDPAGNLYGTTFSGGANSSGTVFQLTPNSDGSWTESVLYAFCSVSNCGDGASPLDSLIFDDAGSLYGTTREGGSSSGCNSGCGTVFKLAPNSDGSWTESVLYSFCSVKGCRDGRTPYFAGVIFDQVGNLYGTTYYGGRSAKCGGQGCGTVFKLAHNSDGSWTESVLHTFCFLSGCRDGAGPLDSLISDQAGNVYGTTEFSDAGGLVFQLMPNADGSWKEKVLHSFKGGRDGTVPEAPLTFDVAGNLYGTTFEGGQGGGAGVVFKLAPTSKGGWHETVLHAFRDHPGSLPYAGVTFDAAGNIYGTTSGDSNSTFGSAFEITP